LRLICFPYAGGGIRTYLPWADSLPADVELVAVQPPGRGAFLDTPAFNEMNALVSALYHQILPLLDRPYVLFGHSLGSRVAFELLVQLQRQQQALPKLFIASGSNSPDSIRTKSKTFHLPDAEFIAELARMNGTPQEVLANAELMSLLLPLLRSDFEIAKPIVIPALASLIARFIFLAGLLIKMCQWQSWRTGAPSLLVKHRCRLLLVVIFLLRVNKRMWLLGSNLCCKASLALYRLKRGA